MAAELKTMQQGQTLILTLSNPEFRNALRSEIHADSAVGVSEILKKIYKITC